MKAHYLLAAAALSACMATAHADTFRLRMGGGTVQVAIEPATGGRAKVSVAHEKLPDLDAVEEWRFYWAEWLAALDAT